VVSCEQQPTDEFCSLTQGAYGNPNGKFNGVGRVDLINNLLGAGGITIGKPGRSITFPAGSALCIIARMPAGGSPKALPATIGDLVATTDENCLLNSGLPIKNGKFANVLIGQTLALSLNVRLDCHLGTYAFCDVPEGQPVVIITRAALSGPDGIFGDPDGCTGNQTSDDVSDPNPGPDLCLNTADDATKVVIPATVISALKLLHLAEPSFNVDVNGLLELANRALAGDLTYITMVGGTIGDINNALDAVNTGFDECRFIVCCGTPATCDFATCVVGSSVRTNTTRVVASANSGNENKSSQSFLERLDALSNPKGASLFWFLDQASPTRDAGSLGPVLRR
jgi:hypothetical protein